MSVFNSNAEEIRYHARQLLDGGEQKTKLEIIAYLQAVASREFTQGMISGALNDLITKEPVYQRLRLGVYQKAPQPETHYDELDTVIKNAIAAIESALKMDIRTLTPELLRRKQEKSERYIRILQGLLP